MNSLKMLLSIAIVSVVFVSCGTTTLQTKAKVTRTITLDHSKNRNDIYLQVTNTAGSGGENMKLEDNIREKLVSKGYRIVDSSSDADYGLYINTLFANNLKQALALKAGTAGALVGGSSAALSGASGSDSLIIGAVVALGAGIGAKAMEDEIFRAVTDVSIRDYSKHDKDKNTDYVEHKTRVFVEAVKVELKLDEAMPIMEEKISRQLTNLF